MSVTTQVQQCMTWLCLAFVKAAHWRTDVRIKYRVSGPSEVSPKFVAGS